MKGFRVELLTPEGQETIGELRTEEVIVGRDPDHGIKVENQAISRNHGLFLPLRDHWFYRDLGSTNGSWVNGVAVPAGRGRIVRAGDTIQLATSALRLEYLDARMAESARVNEFYGSRPSLVVFQNDKFQDEFPVPEYGRALVVGGSQADLQIDGLSRDLPSLVIERRGEKICTFRVEKDYPVTLNDTALNESRFLNDGDDLRLGPYSIVLNYPMKSKDAEPQHNRWATEPAWSAGSSGVSPAVDPSLMTYPDNPRPTRAPVFGKIDEPSSEPLGVNSTIMMSPEEMRASIFGLDRSGLPRQPGFSDDSSGGLSPLEKNLVILIVLIVVIGATLLFVAMGR